MRMIILLLLAILATFCLGEVTLRLLGHKHPPLLNLNYTFYAPHLRNTPVNQHAKRILVLGDAFTFGSGLPWEKTYIHRLQSALDQTFGQRVYQFLNAGHPGSGTRDQLSYLEKHGEELDPSYVLVFLNTDDVGLSIQSDLYNLSPSDAMLIIRNYRPVKLLLRNILYNNWLYTHSVLLQFMHDFFYRQYHTFYNIPSQYANNIIIPISDNLTFRNEFAIRYGENLFLRMNAWCKQHHVKLIIITTGFNAFYARNLKDPTKSFLSHAKVFFEKEEIAYYDIAIPFEKLSKGKHFQILGTPYPNTTGAKLIAQISWPWLKQQINNTEDINESSFGGSMLKDN